MHPAAVAHAPWQCVGFSSGAMDEWASSLCAMQHWGFVLFFFNAVVHSLIIDERDGS